MAAIQQLGQGHSITAHAWNIDSTKVAICPNNNELQIFAKTGAEWKLEHTLAQHDSVITGVDWAPRTNRIVTCSQDRNAYVWTFDAETGTWVPALVLLRINRAATDVKWSPNEDKFAVASAAKVVSVCHFDPANDWWVSKHIKKHSSTVTHIAWHPNNVLLATSSTDYKARVFSAAIKGVDKKPAPTAWGESRLFGDVLQEYEANSWVHAVAFSPSGNALAFASHDSMLTVVESASGAVTNVRMPSLPLMDLLFLEETKLIGVGHDCQPLLFTSTNGKWAYTKGLDEKPAAAAATAASTQDKFKKFQNMVDKGTTDSSSIATTVSTKHQNTITAIRIFKKAGDKVTEFTTSGLDGFLVFWKN